MSPALEAPGLPACLLLLADAAWRISPEGARGVAGSGAEALGGKVGLHCWATYDCGAARLRGLRGRGGPAGRARRGAGRCSERLTLLNGGVAAWPEFRPSGRPHLRAVLAR